MTAPRVSIVIPTFNGAATLPALLEAIAGQDVGLPVETVAIDSGSTDGSRDWLASRVDRFIAIEPGEFNHGGTRNRGVAAASGELAVLVVQDALPASRDWLARLVAPLVEDARVAGSWARQAPRAEASAIARHYLAGWIGSSKARRVFELASADVLASLPPIERMRACSFDNVCSCVRRSVWERIPFPQTPIAEDLEWARAVLLAGGRLVYVPDAVVLHSHDRPAAYELGRTYLLHQRLRRLFGVSTVPSALHLVRAVLSSAALHARLVAAEPGRRSPGALLRALALAVAWPLGQYLGARSADSGREWLRPRGV